LKTFDKNVITHNMPPNASLMSLCFVELENESSSIYFKMK